MKLENKEFFANSVHKHIVYQDVEKSLFKYKNRLLNELKLRKLGKDYFKGKVIIDIGTGFQAIILAKMGAKLVYHLDQSKQQISWMQEYCCCNNINNIRSIECDITKAVPVDDYVDLVLVFGVLHHLTVPSDFIKKLTPKLNLTASQIWLRIYRSGSWSRWLVANLRVISKNLSLERVENFIDQRYPYNMMSQWKGDLLDDFFAPVWQAFHPNQFYIKGVSHFINYQDWQYNFNDYDENFRVNFSVNHENIEVFKKYNFPNYGVDQTKFKFDKSYSEANIAQKLFDQWNYTNTNQIDLINKLVTFYELVRKKPFFDPYTQSHYFDNKNLLNTIDCNKRLDLLTFLLVAFTKDK